MCPKGGRALPSSICPKTAITSTPQIRLSLKMSKESSQYPFCFKSSNDDTTHVALSFNQTRPSAKTRPSVLTFFLWICNASLVIHFPNDSCLPYLNKYPYPLLTSSSSLSFNRLSLYRALKSFRPTTARVRLPFAKLIPPFSSSSSKIRFPSNLFNFCPVNR